MTNKVDIKIIAFILITNSLTVKYVFLAQKISD